MFLASLLNFEIIIFYFFLNYQGAAIAGMSKLWLTPKGHRLESHTKTLTKDGVRRRSQLHPLANDWREAWRVVRDPP